MNRSISLAQALQRAAQDLSAAEPPPQLLAAVLARRRAAGAAEPAQAQPAAEPAPRHLAPTPAARKRPASAPGGRRWAWPGAWAAALVLVGSVVLLLRTPPVGQPRQGLDELRFVNLVPQEQWPREASAAWLVRTEFTGDRLAALGLPFDPAHAGQPVRAEVLMRATGEVLAVRFVP